MRRSTFLVLWCIALAGVVILAAASALLGELNQDEGWYLYAARLITEGRLPYLHFASTQGPLLPLVYAAGFPFVRWFGILGGRELTALIAFVALLVSPQTAWKLASDRTRPLAALLTLMLLGLNVYHAYFMTITKTYALTCLWLACGFLSLASARGRFWHCALAGAYIGLAAATRISAGIFGPVISLVLLWHAWRSRESETRLAWFGFGLGWAVTLGLVLFPFFWFAPEAFRFGMFEYHAARDGGALITRLAYKAGFVARVIHAYYVPMAVACLAGFLAYRKEKQASTNTQSWERQVVQSLWFGVAAVTLVHLSAPFPYDDYEVIAAPLFCIGTALLVARNFVNRREYQERVALAIGLLCVAGCVASPVLESWFIGARDRIWWPLKAELPLTTLERAADRVRQLSGDGDELLTQDLYLAVEAGMTVPAGLEMGPFSYFPDLSDEKAKACHVLNRAMMQNLLTTCDAPVAAWSDYGLAIACPAVKPVPDADRAALWKQMLTRYQPAGKIETFGQAGTTLQILVRNTESPARRGE